MDNNVGVYCYCMNIKDVENLAELARIDLTEAEKQDLLKDMGGILDYVKQVEGVEAPARNATHNVAGGEDIKMENDLYNVWREDEVEPREFSSELIKKQFPDSQDGFLKVKKIL